MGRRTRPSADRVVPEFQKVEVGDWVPMYTKVNDVTAFKVASIEPPRHLLWVKPDSTWVWQLTDLGGRTRLVTRLRILCRWHKPGEAVFSVILNEFGDFPMMRRMLRTLRRNIEAAPRR